MRSARIFLPSLGTKACAVPGPCSGLASYICSRGSHEFVCTSDLFDETVVACCLKMSSRPHGFGMTAELQRKQAAKYDKGQELEARAWVEKVTGENIAWGDDNFPGQPIYEAFKTGELLCRLANALKSGAVTKVNDISKVTNEAFRKNKSNENVGKFLAFMDSLGIKKADQFMTADLMDKTNLLQVVAAIHALGRAATKNNLTSHRLGPDEATACPREFTEEQLRAGDAHIGLQAGSNKGASQAGDHYGRPRQVAGANVYK